MNAEEVISKEGTGHCKLLFLIQFDVLLTTLDTSRVPKCDCCVACQERALIITLANARNRSKFALVRNGIQQLSECKIPSLLAEERTDSRPVLDRIPVDSETDG